MTVTASEMSKDVLRNLYYGKVTQEAEGLTLGSIVKVIENTDDGVRIELEDGTRPAMSFDFDTILVCASMQIVRVPYGEFKEGEVVADFYWGVNENAFAYTGKEGDSPLLEVYNLQGVTGLVPEDNLEIIS